MLRPGEDQREGCPVPLTALDHINVRTANLDAMVEFYGRVLGLISGDRPPFDFPGAWLYCDEKPVIHLVGVESEPKAVEPKMEHVAFAAAGLAEFLARLRGEKVPYRVRVVPGFHIRQVHLYDPDGNHLHIDFDRGAEPT